MSDRSGSRMRVGWELDFLHKIWIISHKEHKTADLRPTSQPH